MNDHGQKDHQETREKPRFWKRPAFRFVLGLAIFFFVLVGIFMTFENWLIFSPSRYPDGDWNPAGLDFEDVYFTSDDGTKLHGWYLPCKTPDYVILFCHGNAGNITNRAFPAAQLHDRLNASVFVFDYRGYGKSDGSPSERGVLADARAARDWLAQRENVEPEEIVLLGRSLGGAVAVDLATTDGARALVLQSTFTSIPDMATIHYRWIPRWLIRTKLDSLSKIGSYSGPVFSSHGEADTIVPYTLGKQLFDAATGPKEFMTLEGLGHNNPQPPAYYDSLRDFLDRNAPAAR